MESEEVVLTHLEKESTKRLNLTQPQIDHLLLQNFFRNYTNSSDFLIT